MNARLIANVPRMLDVLRMVSAGNTDPDDATRIAADLVRDIDEGESEANARLIANAPAMLDMLRLVDRALCEIRRTNLRSVPGFSDTYALSSAIGALLREIDGE